MSSMIIKSIADALEALGFDLSEEGKKETPQRFVKYLEEMLAVDPYQKWSTFDSKGVDEMVIKTHIRFSSACEHHLLPFFGVAHVAYIPNGQILGLSKISRLVEIVSHKFSTQEYVTREILDKMKKITGTESVFVSMTASHTCEGCRGVRSDNLTTTQAIDGAFRLSEARAEVMATITHNHMIR